MKNCELAEFGSLARAMPSVPRLNGVGRKLGLQIGKIGTARPGAGRIAGLGHEAGNDAMEDDAVVELALHQRLDLRDVLGRQIGPEADDDLAVLGGQDQRVLLVVVGQRGARRAAMSGNARTARRLNNSMRTS